MTLTQHLSDIEMATYVDGNGSTRSLAQMQEHLAACDECRHLLVESNRLIESARPRSSLRSWGWKAGLPAIAALLLLAFVPRMFERADTAPILPSVAVERRADAGRETAIRTILPAEDASVSREGIRFAWVPDDGASYRVTVTDATGGPVWETTTSDTTAVLPLSVVMPPDSRFYWYVDALRLDGSSATSGRQSFTTRSK